ncbi:MAG: ATP-grasp domain-containing protein [Bdellovibrionaceae bacterium]|nr:ATP-grasp domain-containing protein [Pseudobdellovibrionaceae bacterium]
MMAKNVALVFGGTSNERLVSVASAQNVVRYFQDPDVYFVGPQGYWFQVTIDELLGHKNPFVQEFQPKMEPVSKDMDGMVARLKHKVCFIALHGTAGEDGTYQKFFETHQIAYTGSSSESSRTCFDKMKAKSVARANDMTLAAELRVHFGSADSVTQLKSFFVDKKKIVLKPNANGSSYGLYIVSSMSELEFAISEIRKASDQDYIAEEFISGREITVGVMERPNQTLALAPSEVLLEAGANFDYQGKYLGRGSKEVTPADLNPVQKKACQDLALRAHKIFGCLGYSRTDMILTNAGPIFIETNTLPGMTKASFYPQQLEAEKISFQEFLDLLLMSGLSRYQKV